jgi:hypothetical protein
VGKAARTGRRVRRVKRAALIAGAIKVGGARRRIRQTKRAALMLGAAKVGRAKTTRRRRAATVALATKPQRRMRAR